MQPSRRPVLSRVALITVLAVSTLLTILFFFLRPLFEPAWSNPGSAQLYLTGVVGALLCLTPMAFFLAKRSGLSASPPTWFIAHVVLSCLGVGLLLVHSALHWSRMPALLLLAAFFLLLQGLWARTMLPYRISASFGKKYGAFTGSKRPDKRKLSDLIKRKKALLTLLAAADREATFSLLLSHWIHHPRLSFRFQGLVNEEARAIGQRQALPMAQLYWRRIHILVALLFLLGLIIHVITVTFFAGYVADGGDIHWWHISDWGGPEIKP